MKKLIKIIPVLIIIICAVFIIFFIKSEKEELEVLNKDVSINNIKSILEIETQSTSSEMEVPLGCKDNKIYLLKYDSDNQKYNNNVYILKEDKTVEKSDIIVPEQYINEKNIEVYGEKIFDNCSYFDWSTGTEGELISNKSTAENNGCYSVNGNSDFVLLKNDEEYTLYNIKSSEKYTYECSDDSKNIKAISFNKNKEEFYVLDKLNDIDKVIIDGNSFDLEKCNEVQLEENLINKNGNNYFSSSADNLYLGSGIINNEIDLNNEKKEFTIKQYNIDDNSLVSLENVSICGYDKYYEDYVLVKKNDNENNKTYLAKLTDDGFDVLMELEKTYGNESNLTIHMSDAQNVLIKETYYDKEEEIIRNKYSVYDLTEYFTQNEYVLNNDGTWSENENNINLKNTLKNINDSNHTVEDVTKIEDQNIKNTSQEENKPIEKVEENNYVENTKNDNSSEDYRKNDSSWKQGNGDWFYYDDGNKKITGWLKTNDKWYYFDENGVMQKNSLIVEKEGQYELGEAGNVINFIPSENAELINKEKDTQSENSESKIDRKKEIDYNLARHKTEKSKTNNDKKDISVDENEDDSKKDIYVDENEDDDKKDISVDENEDDSKKDISVDENKEDNKKDSSVDKNNIDK